ncbi:MAG: hypothetical protein AAGC93_04505 [Cyanobacteria bacterium P01_F01_bin.53]
MRRLLLIALVTVPLTGCQFFNRGEDVAVIDLVEAVESGDAIPDAPQFGGGDSPAEAEPEADEAFADPTVESDSPGVVSADLIRSTDPAARTRQVERSRLDPFATLPIPPTPEPVELPEAAMTRAASSNSGAAGANAASNASSSGTAAATPPEPTPPPVRVQPNNAPLVEPSPIATLPPVPQPVIAPTVSVSGVVQLGNEPYAILRSGSEPERYVRVGDRIAGGAVRVKRIETLAFEPRVILEENGIEVARPISAGASESPETPEAAAEPVAASPASASSPVATVPVVAPSASSSTLPVPPATVSDTQASNTQAVVPGMTFSTPTNATLPASGEVPSSLVLQPADADTQAVLPNLQLTVPGG